MSGDDTENRDSRMIKRGYIFDYGGTLDTNGCHWGKELWHAYERCRIGVSEEDFRQAYVHGERTLASTRIVMPSFTFRDTLQAKIKLQLGWLADNGKIQAVGEMADRLLDDVYARVCHTTEESVRVLTQLAKDYPLVLVSNFYGNINTVLKEFHFDGLFADVIESAVVGVRKPDPRIFMLGVEKLHLAPGQVTVVGDSYDKDIVPAHTIGCRTVWIKGEGWTDDEVKNPVADRTIDRLLELL